MRKDFWGEKKKRSDVFKNLPGSQQGRAWHLYVPEVRCGHWDAELTHTAQSSSFPPVLLSALWSLASYTFSEFLLNQRGWSTLPLRSNSKILWPLGKSQDFFFLKQKICYLFPPFQLDAWFLCFYPLTTHQRKHAGVRARITHVFCTQLSQWDEYSRCC